LERSERSKAPILNLSGFVNKTKTVRSKVLFDEVRLCREHLWAPAKCHAWPLRFFTMLGARTRSYQFCCASAETRDLLKMSSDG
jgi:hypothetical protein